ncbi:hypothetical protein LCGC14_2653130 [marine sediment metagenome]|uniref:Tyr recombinase domain-containing protein n=1 Tax=marine sediment metagenome TaxID=412755 RepID=A0A0F9CLA9_9ZZZZ
MVFCKVLNCDWRIGKNEYIELSLSDSMVPNMRVLPKTISEAELLKGVKAARSNQQKIALLLGFYQCMRVSEVVNLTKSDVDRGRGFLHILNAKGGKDRDVPIMPPVLRGLKFLPIGKSIRTLQRCSQALVGVKFHTLRHSGATFYLNDRGVDIRFIQQLLGHSRLDTTQIYTHVTPEGLKATFEEAWK